MPYQNLSGVIPDAVITLVNTKLDEIEAAIMQYLVNLAMSERSNLYKMGPTRFSLGQKVIIVCDTLPAVVPNFVNVADLKDDWNNALKLDPIHQRFLQLSESLGDTIMAHRSEVMKYGAKPIYASAKVAKDQNVPGADSAYDLLNPYYDLPDQPDGGNP